MSEKTAVVTCENCGVRARRPATWQDTQLLEDALPSDQPEGWAKLTLEWEICPSCVEAGEDSPPREGEEKIYEETDD